MTSPGGREVGRVSIRVLPDTSVFARSLQRHLTRIERTLRVQVPVTLDETSALGEARRVTERLSRAGRVELAVEPQTLDAQREVTSLIRRLSGQVVNLRVDVDRDRITRALGSVGSLGASVGRLTRGVGLLGIRLAAVSFGALASQAAVAGVLQLTAALAPLVGLVGLLPAVAVGAAVGIATLKLGLAGFGEALKSLDDPEKFAAAIARLAPSARDTALAIQGMKPALDGLQLTVQQRLFTGLAGVVQQLGATYLPLLIRVLGAVAGSFNTAIRSAAGFLTLPKTSADLSAGLGNVSLAFTHASGALRPLVAALTDIFVVGSSFLPRFGTAITDAANRFAGFIARSRESGALAAGIQRALDVLRDLWAITKNVGSALAGVFDAARAAGAGVLSMIKEVTAEIATQVKSVAGQDALRQFFAGAGAAVRALLPVIGGLIQVIGAIGPILGEVGRALGPIVGEILNQLAEALRVAGPGIVAFAQGLGSVASLLAPLLPLFGQVVAAIGTGLGAALSAAGPGITELARGFLAALQAVTPLLPILGQLAGVIGTALGQALSALAPVLGQVATSLGQSLLTAVQALAPVFVQLVTALLPLLPPLTGIIELAAGLIAVLAPFAPVILALVAGFKAYALAVTVITAATRAWAAVQAVIDALMLASPIGLLVLALVGLGAAILAVVKNWDTITAAVSSGFSSLRSSIGGAVSSIIATFADLGGGFSRAASSVLALARGLGGSILSSLGSPGTLLYDPGASIIRGLIRGITSMLSTIGATMSNLVSTVRSYLPFSPAKRGPLRRYPPDAAGRTIARMLAGGIDEGRALVARAAGGLAGAATAASALSGAPIPVVAAGGAGLSGGALTLEALTEAFTRALASGELRARGDDLTFLVNATNRRQARR